MFQIREIKKIIKEKNSGKLKTNYSVYFCNVANDN